MTDEEYDTALKELYSQGQSAFDKYLRRAELVQSTGHHNERDTLDLAIEMFWKEQNV